MGYKLITLIFSLLLMTYTLRAEEETTLYLKKVNFHNPLMTMILGCFLIIVCLQICCSAE